MSWSFLLIFALVLVAIVLLKRVGQLSSQAARAHLKNGALVVDVRSPQEYNARHLRGAVNIPLGELQERIGRRVPDKNRVLLLHCLSGTRSGVARRQLRSMGYTSVFNLGSLGRAQRIINAK